MSVKKIHVFALCIFCLLAVSSKSQSGSNPAPSKIEGNFNVLVMTTDQFRKLSKDKYIFQYVVQKDGELSMQGWYARGAFGRKFDPTSTVTLRVWKQGDCSYTNGFLGDYVLMRHGFRKIRKALTRTTRYIVFVPVCETKAGEKSFSYHIKISDDEIFPKETGILATFALRDIGVVANPSPPKNFY